MARNQGVDIPTARGGPKAPVRGAGPSKPVATPVSAVAAAPKKKTSLTQFFREVRIEARKITWTSWKETWITSVMVGIMVVTTAIFFLVVDSALSFLIQQVLKLAA